MPTYEYACACGRVFEDFRSMPGEPELPCPACGRLVRRNVGPGAGLIFRGIGFYATDYRKKEGER